MTNIDKELDPAKIAPLLWNAYKDTLNEEDLANLKDVIVNQRDDYNFEDDDQIINAFRWDATKQGNKYWAKIDNDIKNGTYIKPSSVAVGCVVEPLCTTQYEEPSNIRIGGLALESFYSQEVQQKLDKHYNFMYHLSKDEVEDEYLRVDPYFVAKQWKLGKKDDSGVLFHCLKTIARFGDKNPIEREIKALHLQVKRLAELNNVELD